MNDEIVIGGDMADIPPGTYEATLKSVTVKESEAWGEFRAWDFELSNGAVVGGGSSMATGGRSKGGQWIAALLGRKPEKGENVTTAIIGARCLVVVVEGAGGWPKVESVLPPMVAGPRPLAPVAAQDAPPPAAAPVAAPTPVSVPETGKVDILDDLPF